MDGFSCQTFAIVVKSRCVLAFLRWSKKLATGSCLKMNRATAGAFVVGLGQSCRGGCEMASPSRLTLVCAAALTMLPIAAPAFAQAGPAAGAAGAPAAPAPAQGEEENGGAQAPPSQVQP